MATGWHCATRREAGETGQGKGGEERGGHEQPPCLHADLLYLGSILQSSGIIALEEPPRFSEPNTSVHISAPFGPALNTPSYRKSSSYIQEAGPAQVQDASVGNAKRKEASPLKALIVCQVLMRHATYTVSCNPHDNLMNGD